MLILALLTATIGQVDARTEKDGVHVHMEATIDAPVDLVATVVGDVERYPAWLPIIGSVRPAPTFALAPLFDTEWRLPWPLGTLHQRMRFERMPAEDGVSFFFEQRAGDMKRHAGYWVLTRAGARTHVIYDATVAFETWVPPFLVAAFQRSELPKLMRKLETEAKRRAST